MQRREAASGLRLPSPASITGFPYISDTGGNRSGSAKTSQTGFANAGRESGAPRARRAVDSRKGIPYTGFAGGCSPGDIRLPKTILGSIALRCGGSEITVCGRTECPLFFYRIQHIHACLFRRCRHNKAASTPCRTARGVPSAFSMAGCTGFG